MYFCVFLYIVCFVTFSCIVSVYMCTEQLPPGGYPIAVKYIISYHSIRCRQHVPSTCGQSPSGRGPHARKL